MIIVGDNIDTEIAYDNMSIDEATTPRIAGIDGLSTSGSIPIEHAQSIGSTTNDTDIFMNDNSNLSRDDQEDLIQGNEGDSLSVRETDGSKIHTQESLFTTNYPSNSSISSHAMSLDNNHSTSVSMMSITKRQTRSMTDKSHQSSELRSNGQNKRSLDESDDAENVSVKKSRTNGRKPANTKRSKKK